MAVFDTLKGIRTSAVELTLYAAAANVELPEQPYCEHSLPPSGTSEGTKWGTTNGLKYNTEKLLVQYPSKDAKETQRTDPDGRRHAKL